MERTDRGRRPMGSAASATRLVRAVLAAVVGAVSLLGASIAVSATAQDQPVAPTRVTAVDASGGRVVASLFTEDLDPRSVLIREDGVEAKVSTSTASSRQAATEIVFVVDTDNRNVSTGVLAGFIDAIDRGIENLPPSVQVAAVRAGAETETVTRLTDDRSKPAVDLRAVSVDLQSSLYDGVVTAAESFDGPIGTIRTVVVLAGGPDTASSADVGDAEAALIQSGAQLVSVTIGAADEGLARMAATSGGANLVVAPTEGKIDGRVDGKVDGRVDLSAIADQVAAATDLAADRLLLTYASPEESGPRPGVEVDIDGRLLSFSYPAGVLTTNPLQLVPNVAEPAQGAGPLGHPAVLYASIALAFAAISGTLWALGSMYAGGESSLDKVLARYSDRDDSLEEAEVQEMLVQTALIQRAVALTESFAERRGFLTRIEEMLERANLPIRAGEAMSFVSIGVLLLFGGVFASSGSVLGAGVVAMVCAVASYVILQLAAKRRLKAFEAQLPDTLQLLAGTLRAGYSLPQGLDAVSLEISDPMGHELRRAITEAQLGRELDDALANIAERLDSPDFAWAVMAIGIQREVGGNLAEVLLTVSETMIQRDRLQREVAALTAEGRVSAGILAMMPPGLGLVMWVMNPAYVGVLFSRTIGLVLVGLAVVSGLIGLAWMKKVITIDA